MIHLLPRSGLGNRMRAIDSAISLGAELRTSVDVYWVPDDGLACPFDHLFEPFRESFVTVHACTRRPVKFLYLQPHFYAMMRQLNISPNRFAAHDVQRLINYPFHTSSSPNLFIASHSKFYIKPTDYSRFTPIVQLRNRITAQTASFDAHTVGVHIRRTDHSIAIDKSPDALFIQKMQDAVNAQTLTRFYLATDSEQVKREMTSIFGARLMASSQAASRKSIEGMQSALVDLYTLAATSRILGSFGSSYSTIASEIGQIELIRLMDSPDEVIHRTHV